jgi:hypothetical protein
MIDPKPTSWFWGINGADHRGDSKPRARNPGDVSAGDALLSLLNSGVVGFCSNRVKGRIRKGYRGPRLGAAKESRWRQRYQY